MSSLILEMKFFPGSCNCSMSLWNEALGFQKPKLHGECFNGNQFTLLLKNLDVLVQIVRPGACFRNLEIIHRRCFKMFFRVKR